LSIQRGHSLFVKSVIDAGRIRSQVVPNKLKVAGFQRVKDARLVLYADATSLVVVGTELHNSLWHKMKRRRVLHRAAAVWSSIPKNHPEFAAEGVKYIAFVGAIAQNE
jgi:hypothetical protein